MIGEQDAIGAELIVGGTFPAVSPVTEELLAVAIRAQDRLVGEVPDEPTLEQRFAVGQVDVAFRSAEGVAHGVGVLAQDEGLGAMGLEELLHRGGRGVHLAVDIGGLGVSRIPGDPLVVHRAVVLLAEVGGDVTNVRAAIGLVSA